MKLFFVTLFSLLTLNAYAADEQSAAELCEQASALAETTLTDPALIKEAETLKSGCQQTDSSAELWTCVIGKVKEGNGVSNSKKSCEQNLSQLVEQ